MVRVVVGADRAVPGADPATVWALVADPARVSEWTPLRLVGRVGTELPAVGNVFSATRHRRSAEPEATRFQFVEWNAGRSYRCAMSEGGLATDREIEVRVHAVLEDDGAHTTVQLIHRADVPAWAAPAYRFVAERRIERALTALCERWSRE